MILHRPYPAYHQPPSFQILRNPSYCPLLRGCCRLIILTKISVLASLHQPAQLDQIHCLRLYHQPHPDAASAPAPAPTPPDLQHSVHFLIIHFVVIIILGRIRGVERSIIIAYLTTTTTIQNDWYL